MPQTQNPWRITELEPELNAADPSPASQKICLARDPCRFVPVLQPASDKRSAHARDPHIKAKPKPQRAEMVKALKADPTLKVFVIGHSNNQGKLDYNTGLSQSAALKPS